MYIIGKYTFNYLLIETKKKYSNQQIHVRVTEKPNFARPLQNKTIQLYFLKPETM